MMAVEEGGGLLDTTTCHNHSKIIENCLDHISASKLWLLTICLALGNAADAVEIMCIGFIMADIPDISTSYKEWLSSAVFIGMLVGGLLCGYLSDHIGRRPCLLGSLFINACAGLASAAVPNIPLLILCRVIAGLGIGGSVPIVFALGAEIFPCAIRGKQLSVIASFWMVGALYTATAAWVMLGNDSHGQRIMPNISWRIFAIVCSLPAFFTLILTYFVIPESPRYLLSKKKYNEIKNVLKQLTGVIIDSNQFSTSSRIYKELVQSNNSNYQEVVSDLHVLGDEDAFSNSKHTQKSTDQKYPISNIRNNENDDFRDEEENTKYNSSNNTILLLFNPALRYTTICLIFIWFTLCFGSYGLSTWISVLFEDIGLSNAFADSFIFSVANLPGNVVSILFIERIGRKRLLSWGMSLAGLSAVGFALGIHEPAVVVGCAALFNAFSVAGWNALDCMSVESFPTNVRTSAMGVLAAAGRLGAIAAQFVNGSLEDNIPALLFVTTGCMVLGGLLAFALPNDNTGSNLVDVATSPTHSDDSKVEFDFTTRIDNSDN